MNLLFLGQIEDSPGHAIDRNQAVIEDRQAGRLRTMKVLERTEGKLEHVSVRLRNHADIVDQYGPKWLVGLLHHFSGNDFGSEAVILRGNRFIGPRLKRAEKREERCGKKVHDLLLGQLEDEAWFDSRMGLSLDADTVVAQPCNILENELEYPTINGRRWVLRESAGGNRDNEIAIDPMLPHNKVVVASRLGPAPFIQVHADENQSLSKGVPPEEWHGEMPFLGSLRSVQIPIHGSRRDGEEVVRYSVLDIQSCNDGGGPAPLFVWTRIVCIKTRRSALPVSGTDTCETTSAR